MSYLLYMLLLPHSNFSRHDFNINSIMFCGRLEIYMCGSDIKSLQRVREKETCH